MRTFILITLATAILTQPQLITPASANEPEPVPSSSPVAPSASPSPIATEASLDTHAYLGVIPDYLANHSRPPGEPADSKLEAGLRVAGVHKKSPAATAGIRAGDTLKMIEMPPSHDGKRSERKLASLADYMSALEDVHPGDTVIIHLRRDAQDVVVSIEAGERSKRVAF